jgi:uncharacterized protein
MVAPMSCNAGVGLRSVHYPHLEKEPPKSARWFEAVSENYMDSWGRPREFLHSLRKDFPVALHGVGMSLASSSGLDRSYLGVLADLANEIEPFIVSDHLCWTGNEQRNLHDLLPFPHTEESIDIVVNNLDQAQNVLGRPIFVENVSTYMTFASNEMMESEFITEVAKRAGTKLLLDINNIYVNATNHGFEASTFLKNIPVDLVGQIHLAGYSDMGDHLFDTHSKPVWPPVWKLFSEFIKRAPNIPFMIEWDEDIPSFPGLEAELAKAKNIWREHHPKVS